MRKKGVLRQVAIRTVVLGPPRKMSPPNVVIEDEADDCPRDKVYRAHIRDGPQSTKDDWEADMFRRSAQGKSTVSNETHLT
jgi:hypothetical protein